MDIGTAKWLPGHLFAHLLHRVLCLTYIQILEPGDLFLDHSWIKINTSGPFGRSYPALRKRLRW